MIDVTEDEIRAAFDRVPWPHQLTGVTRTFNATARTDAVCFTAETGAGKTVMQAAILRLLMAKAKRCIIYNSRRPLIAQLSRTLEEAGIYHGTRAASMRNQQDLSAHMQIGSMQTDYRRVMDQGCWDTHRCDLVIVDECHLPDAKAERAQKLIQAYLATGAKVVGYTGTPLGVSHIYKELVTCGDNQRAEMRRVGAHVPAKTYTIHQLDTSRLKPTKTGEFKEGDIRKDVWSPSIVGYAYQDWIKVGGDKRGPAMASAPGVGESIWVCKQWMERGHKVAHIDAKECVVNGERYSGDVREQVLADARKGEFDLISSCEVLSTGVDLPILGSLIMLRPFGGLAAFLQCAGRVIRAYPGQEDVVITDHVGNTLRHGSVNAERDWDRLFHMTESEIAAERKQKLENNELPEPITCIKCGKMRESGARCPECGEMSDKRERRIVEQDGTLTLHEGRQYLPPKPKKPPKPKEQKQLESLVWRMKKSGRWTGMNQVLAIYAKDFGSMPPGHVIDTVTSSLRGY